MKLFRRRRREGRHGSRFAYSAWDGTQTGFDYDAESLFDQLTDELLYHGDLNAALRRLMQRGFEDRSGEHMDGLRDLMDRLADQRQQMLDNFDLGSIYDDIIEELNEIVEIEREELEQELASSDDDDANFTAPGDGSSKGKGKVKRGDAADRLFDLDMLPDDLPSKVRELQAHDFASDEAKQRFDDLVERLTKEMTQSAFNQMTNAMDNMTPADMERVKQMMAALNQMLEQRAAGVEPDFKAFMDEFGDMVPGNPQTLDELLEQMAQQMAAMEQMLNSMSPEQQEQLRELMEALMSDLGLQFEMSRLMANLRQAFPNLDWEGRRRFGGDQSISMPGAAAMMNQLGQLDALRQMLGSATTPAALAEVDPEEVEKFLGAESAEALDRLSELARMLEERGLATTTDGHFELTPKAMRRLGQNALADLFRKLNEDSVGRHHVMLTGIGHERAYETKAYEFGDNFHLNIERTVRNAVTRSGPGTPVRLLPDDFEIDRTELASRASTVLMLDLSLSMPMRDNFLPAKKVTMALHSLITSQFPRDYLGLVGFAASAHEFTPQQLPEISWDFEYGTNMQHGLQIARRLLARQSGSKQIIMITDGEPTAHIGPDGYSVFDYPPSRETVELTMLEVARATREDIRINVFMLEPDGSLRAFVEMLTKMNGGRAFFTSAYNLGDYVLVDFLEHRRKVVSGRR